MQDVHRLTVLPYIRLPTVGYADDIKFVADVTDLTVAKVAAVAITGQIQTELHYQSIYALCCAAAIINR